MDDVQVGAVAVPDVMFRVSWVERCHHSRDLSAAELAVLMRCTPHDVVTGQADESLLDDALAELDDDGFEFLYREEVTVERIAAAAVGP